MKGIKVCETEILETRRVLDLPGGPVTVYEREVRGHYEPERVSSTRLIISEAIDVTRDFVSKARAEFADLNCLMRDLTAR